MGGEPIVISGKQILQGWDYQLVNYQTIRTANLDQVMKQEVLNGKK